MADRHPSYTLTAWFLSEKSHLIGVWRIRGVTFCDSYEPVRKWMWSSASFHPKSLHFHPSRLQSNSEVFKTKMGSAAFSNISVKVFYNAGGCEETRCNFWKVKLIKTTSVASVLWHLIEQTINHLKMNKILDFRPLWAAIVSMKMSLCFCELWLRPLHCWLCVMGGGGVGDGGW